MAALASFLLLCGVTVALPVVARGDSVGSGCTGNAIVCENQLPGTPQSVWDVDGAGDSDIQGFATQISVNVGETVQFKISTPANAYKIEIYRLGYYQGLGARKIADVTPSATLPQTQPACATDATTEIYDCGTWGVSASWAVPATAVSGVYLAKLTRTSNGDSSHIPFIVRNDASHSDAVFQTSDPTWEAYNTYGQSDFYQGLANGRAYKVSYNRPFQTRGTTEDRSYLFSNEYPTIRFMEQNGYDVSYISGLDTDIRGNLLTNHKTFLSVGHDEYWSDGQRTNVEKARDAGVNLAFLSGNEVYWKTRWEPSEDGTGTANRTLVCYKDTWAGAKIDPLGPTSTWRDPRWGGNGKGPENALTGTLYMSNNTDLPITVSAEEGKTRLWRNTTLANQSPGSSTALAAHTVGYESDEDLDNGSRPAGLIRLSTTTGSTPQYLQDFGLQVAPGTTTHHLTLYRAASGALVFGAGTIQWGWGLDADHDESSAPADVRMRQATVNLFADMGMTASTLAADLVPATKSTDTTPPTAVITSPAANAAIPQGSLVTVTGTATDVGGVVAGVEVSVDGGTSWHPATGTASFTYSGVLTGTGAQAIRVRAIDDSANIQPVPTDLAVVSNCPCSIFGATEPRTPVVNDSGPVTLGVKFSSSADGFITGIRFYKGNGNIGTHVGTLYTSAGAVLATVTFTNESGTGWQSANFSNAVPITAGTTYVAAYTAPNGHYAGDNYYFISSGHTAGALTALGGSADQGNGVYSGGTAFPLSTYQNSNYYVDAVYSASDTTPVSAQPLTPLDGSSSVSTATTATVAFSRSVTPSSIAMTIADSSNTPVAGAVSYDAGTRIATFNPTTPLSPATTYTVRVTATSPDVGPMAAPQVWSFTTAQSPAQPGVCPCTLFDDTDSPTTGPVVDSSVELGAAFTAEVNGTITGVRFYKDPANVGVHTVSLWTGGGALLATATVSTETTSGWQQATFTTPVQVDAGVVYIASYRAPSGKYSYTPSGLSAAINRSPLHTVPNGGRYGYGTSSPTSTSSTNYYVDPVFLSAPNAEPQVVAVAPADNSTSVRVSDPISVTFAGPVQAASTTIVVTDPAGNPVAGAVANESQSTSVSFSTTTPLNPSTLYTVTVSGAKSVGGTQMSAPFVSHFTTAGTDSCPCTLLASTATPQISDSGDSGAISVGLRFSPSVDGYVSGIRYYADAANTGAHTGTLYAPNNTVLAMVTYPAVSAPGWQYAVFDAPVPVAAGSVYVAATYMPSGHYSVSPAFFSGSYVNYPLTGLAGLYTYGSDTLPASSYNGGNYFVDVVFSTSAGSTPTPTVSGQSPAVGATGVAVNGSVSAAFSAPIDQTTLQFVLTGPGGAAVPGSVSYSTVTRAAVFTPTTNLTYGAAYTASLSAKSSGGALMTAPATWSFTTAPPPALTVSGQAPAPGATGAATSALVQGTFSDAVDPTSIQFTVTGSGGAVVRGSVSYNATSRVASFQPASALAAGAVYSVSLAATSALGATMSSPVTWSFTTAAAAAPTPTVSGQSPAAGSTTAAVSASITAKFSIPIDPSTLGFTLTGPNGAAVPGAVTYNSTTRVATLKPSASLGYGSTYSASLVATGSAGGVMAAPVVWSFTTVAPPVPTVTTRSPAAGATGTAVTASVTGTFSVAVDPTSLTFSVAGPNGSPVAGTVSYNTSSRVATFKPSASLGYGSTYSASLVATGSAGGVMAAPVVWSFTTVPPPVPTVSSQTPASGATSVSRTTSVSAKFSVPVNPTSISMTLTGSGGTATPGTVSYNSTTNVVTFKPATTLGSLSRYNVSLTATGVAGGAMTGPANWSFTTRT